MCGRVQDLLRFCCSNVLPILCLVHSFLYCCLLLSLLFVIVVVCHCCCLLLSLLFVIVVVCYCCCYMSCLAAAAAPDNGFSQMLLRFVVPAVCWLVSDLLSVCIS